MQRALHDILRRFGWILIGVLLVGCTAVTVPSEPRQIVYRDVHLETDTVWSGRVLIDGSVRVAKGVTLTIAPGTEVAFVRRDADADGLGDGTLVVEGRLLALGSRAAPIRFQSAAADPRPGDWLEIRVDFSDEVRLRYCELRDSAYTLHAHFTRGVVEDCTIHHNIDGCRLGQANFTFRNNLIEHNQGKGINFRNATVKIHHNILRYNGSGLFLFENDRPIEVTQNNLYGNLDNLRLGDFYAGDVALHDNWWGVSDRRAAQATVYDQSRDPELGRVALSPRPSWVRGTGPRDALALQPLWAYATGGYVDADLVADEERLYVAGWDGKVRALDAAGVPQWTKTLGDTIDAPPLLTDGMLVLQTWSREVYALAAPTGDVLWRFDYSPSRADDHRQGGCAIAGDLLLVPAWNGTLFALDRRTGERRWEFQGGQPLRSAPVWDGERIYLAGGDGTLHVLTVSGELLWQADFAAPLLNSPVLLTDGVAVLSRDGQLVAFTVDGVELWRRELAETCYYGSPVYRDRALYVPTAASALWKFEAATGRLLWRVDTAGPAYATPLLVDDRVFLGDNSGTLQVIGAESGDLLARYPVEREIQGRPLLWAGRLLFGSRDHKVHALQPIDSPIP